jgi:hypothetical protein
MEYKLTFLMFIVDARQRTRGLAIPDKQSLAVGVGEIHAARTRIAAVAAVTPLIEYPILGEAVGGRILIKFEGAQREGSFKFRGAYNRLVQLSAAERKNGVVAWSSVITPRASQRLPAC